MTIPSDVLTSFVPEVLARRILDRSEPPGTWTSEASELVVLGLDISESTAILEDLVRWTPDGPETIARALDGVFSLLADVVTAHRGSIATLAGDEVVAVWPTAETGGAVASVAWAARAATAIRDQVNGLAPVGGYPIRLRAGLGVGRAWLLDVGDALGHRLFVPVGPAFQEMAQAQRTVAAGEIGMSAEVRRLIREGGGQDAAGEGEPAVRATIAGSALRLPTAPAHRRVPVPPALATPYVPDWVAEVVGSGHEDFAELAPITVMFVSLRPRPWDEDGVRAVAEAAAQVLDVLDRYAGTVVNAAQDLEGLTLVAGFGLPPLVREREAARANQAALEVSRAMRQVVEHGIGVATGHAFCGVRGSPAYRQYMMVGPVVNLAARLMQQAQNEVLSDQVSQHLSRDRLRFSARGRMRVKGFAGPVEVYRPEWQEPEPGLPTIRRLAGEHPAVLTRGRDHEREELVGRLVALGLGTSTAVVVEGEPGVGKTHLAVDLLQAGEGYEHVTVLVGNGDDVDPRPYHVWKRAVGKALGLSSVRDPHRRALLVTERLSKWPELVEWAPLLNEVLDLALDDSALRGMTGPARRENTVRVLVQLLGDVAARTPLLIVLDDCHWMDSASWELVRAVHRSVAPTMLVLFTRPVQEPSPQDVEPAGPGLPPGPDEGVARTATEVLTHLREHGALVLRLRPLPADVTEQIARDFLQVQTLDEPVRSLFRGKVDGSPLFTVELAYQLRTDDLISVVGRGDLAQARLAVPPVDLDRLRLPVRVEEVFRARLSALSARQRMVIGAASVIGTSFDAERILAADPRLDAASLAEDLRDLGRKKVIAAHPEGWRFVHALIRDVAQQSLLPSELRQRHRALAEWYESRGQRPETYAVLAHHWAEAGEPARQIEYLEAAATDALAKGAAEEAASLLETALAVDGQPDGPLSAVPDARRAFWEDELAEALATQNRLEDAVTHSRRALALLGHRVPTSRLGWAARLVWGVIGQVLHLVLPRRWRPRGDVTLLGQAAWILSRLAETFYFKAQAVPSAACQLAAINRAERAGNEGLAGRAYGELAYLVGTMRLHRVAARYFDRARWKFAPESTGRPGPLTVEVLPDAMWDHDLTATVSEAVYLRTMNRRRDVTPMLDDVLRQYRSFGQNWAVEVCLVNRGFFIEVTGELRSARADFEELVTSARRRGNTEHALWGMTLLLPLLLSLDRTAEALAVDDEAMEVSSDEYKLFAPVLQGGHVRALVARGRSAEALTRARRAVGAFGMVPYIHLAGLTALVQACLEMLDQERGTPREKEVRRVTRRALRALRTYKRIYPFARTRYELYLGRYRAAQGRDDAARRCWRRGLRTAEDDRLLLDGARLRLCLAAQLPEGSPARAEHLRQARRTIDELGLRRLREFAALAE
ncbi:AAA family ATPase [Geodermatophilus sp. SYSU D00698]